MATIAHLPPRTVSPTVSTPRASRDGRVGRVGACLRLVALAGLGLANPDDVAAAGVAAPGHGRGLCHVAELCGPYSPGRTSPAS